MHSFVSVRLVLFLSSVVVFGVSIFLIQRYSHSTRGGDAYVRRNRVKVIGYVLIFPAFLLLGLAALNDQMATDGSIPVIDPVAAAAAQAYTPPVLPKPKLSMSPPNNTWKPRLSDPNGTSSMLPAAPTSPPEPAANSVSHVPTPEEQLDINLVKVNAQIQVNPVDLDALGTRGNIYAAKREWYEAERDYQSILSIDSNNTKAKFNLAEMSFMQKKYDAARTGFVTLEQDAELGDLSAYKAYLCDLFGGQQDAAAKELDAFNQIGGNASYYFANAAWLLYHKKREEARGWLKSATRIYPPEKFRLYSTTLFEMGYLPLPPEGGD